MELREVVRRRRMVRAYDPDRPVPREVVDRLLEHAVRAPSAGFSQGWDFLVLESAEDRNRYWRSTSGDVDAPDGWLGRMMTAPLLVVCLSHKQAYLDRYAEPDKPWQDRDEAHWPVPYWDVDTGMAALLMLLTAVDEGLGGCFFGVGDTAAIASFRAAFGVPDSRLPVGVVSVGYPAADRRSPSLRRGRREPTQVAHAGRFGTPYPSPRG
ncbi:nitroreductase family protein [Angustibacter speluncae]